MKKMIRLSQHKQEELTFEEVYKQYLPLLNSQSYSWSQSCGYDVEELFQHGAIALWKAYENYSIEREIGFGHFAKIYVQNAMRRYHQLNKPKTRNITSQVRVVESLQSKLSNKKGDDEVELVDLLGTPETFSQDVVDKIVLNKIFKRFSKRQLNDILKYVNGYSKRELAESKDMEYRKAMRGMHKSFQKFRTLYIKEMIGS